MHLRPLGHATAGEVTGGPPGVSNRARPSEAGLSAVAPSVPDMTMTLGMITCDTTDPKGLARWWAEQTGGSVIDPFEGTYVMVDGGPVRLAFQLVDSPTAGKNRLHLDLLAPDIDAEVERLVGAGATLVEHRGDEHFRWATLTDPAGNEFCVAAAGSME